jgi:diacylglycerol O-acyltransferase / wax synthase
MFERLSAFDATMLRLERPATPFHAGGVSVFGPGLSFADVHDTLRERLGAVPLARRRLRSVPFGGGLVWVDDTDFDLSYHLRHAALPTPGSSAQLGEFLSRLIARPLDRSRPLWELYVIEGLRGGRTALFRKGHLAMAGGDGVDPFAVLLEPEKGGSARPDPDVWRPEPAPSPVELAVDAARRRVVDAAHAGRAAARLFGDPSSAVEAASAAAGSALGIAARAARQAPRSPLNRTLTGHRRFAMARADLEDLRRVRAVFGGTINDAVVAVCADAVGRLLRWRGYDTKDLDLRVMVPVRVHQEGGDGAAGAHSLGEAAVGVLAPLPVMEMDPVARLYRIMGELAGLKESRQAVAADRLATLAGYAPANLHTLAARLVIGEQRYNLALSNAPGPQHQLWLGEAPLLESYPFIPLAGDAALSIAVSSYAGVLCFGLLGDRRAVPDLDRLAGFVTDAVDTLVEAAAR